MAAADVAPVYAARQVLDKDGGNVKALYRRAQGHLAVADFVEAEVDLRRALLEEPANKDVRALFKRYKEQVGPSAKLRTQGRQSLPLQSVVLRVCALPLRTLPPPGHVFPCC